ncbi:MAG: diaminopimelate decarboxylase [Clostridiaceae bacterium]|jgi:diaminopimelate decarboxylase|nr:diaminopimelate decarboxylase [Clostridiaceae bacterium]
MFGNGNLKVNAAGHLEIGGCDAIELAKEYGTPLYVMDEMIIRNNCRRYKEAMDKYYDGYGLVLYASKAFCTLAICKIVEQEGLGLDVISGGELFTAAKAGFPMDKIHFHGNNKTPDEIEMGIDYGVGRFVVDNHVELETIERIAREKNKRVEISIRIKPGIDAHTHEFIKTGQIDSKFGVALENGEAHEMVAEIKKIDNVELVGVHCHIGSQIFELAPFEHAAEILLNFIADVKEKYGITIKELNLGGGFGIKYTEKDDPLEYDQFIEAVSKVVKKICKEKGLGRIFMLMEPGRSIVAPAGITLYTVGNVKDIKGARKYVSVDGGMTDNPRYALYQAEYTAVLASNPKAPKTDIVTIAGKCCESGDLVARDIKLQKTQTGDIVAVLATGAYNYSMSMNYNRNTRPPVVLVNNGKPRLIVKREDYMDIIRNDIIPDDL